MLGRKRLSRTYDSHIKFFGGAELAATSGKLRLEFIYLFVIFVVVVSYKSNTCCFSCVKLLQIKQTSLGICRTCNTEHWKSFPDLFFSTNSLLHMMSLTLYHGLREKSLFLLSNPWSPSHMIETLLVRQGVSKYADYT